MAKTETASARVRAYVAKHPDAANAEVAQALGVDRRLVHAARRRGETPGRPRKPRTKAERAAEIAKLQAALKRATAGS